MPRAPLPRPDTVIPKARRVFARVRAFEVCCPACGAVSIIMPRPLRTRVWSQPTGGEYRDFSGLWKCRDCKQLWQVGLVLYPITKGHGLRTRPEDTIPTLEESTELRRLREDPGGYVATRDGAGRRGRANRVCTCGLRCPIHEGE